MLIEQSLLLDLFQEKDSRTAERKNINEILDIDNPSEKLNIV